MGDWTNAAKLYGYGMLAMATFLALIGDNRSMKNDYFRIAFWPVTLATLIGQVLRGLIRMVLP